MLRALLVSTLVLLPACAGDAGSPSARAVRDTLPGGIERMRYAALPGGDPVTPDLRIGTMDGPAPTIFGDVRGIEADSAGTIYVLDYQASEVRAFDPDGQFLRTVATRGRGPGEIAEANGFVLHEGTLWIQDHGQWMMIGVTPEGGEVTRHAMHVRSYGYMWNGAIDDRGRFWKPTSHSDDDRDGMYPPPEGLREGTTRQYFNVFDPADSSIDSIALGTSTYRTYVVPNSRGGHSYYGVPHDPSEITRVDPAGGFWTSHTAQYRIARLNPGGDTVLVIEANVPPVPVTAGDRAEWMSQRAEREPGQRRALEEIAALMPENRPAITDLIVDDTGRLWVRRGVPDGAPPVYDVFDRDGVHHATYTLGFDASPWLPLRVRDGRVYALVRDSMDVPYVMRATLQDPP